MILPFQLRYVCNKSTTNTHYAVYIVYLDNSEKPGRPVRDSAVKINGLGE